MSIYTQSYGVHHTYSIWTLHTCSQRHLRTFLHFMNQHSHAFEQANNPTLLFHKPFRSIDCWQAFLVLCILMTWVHPASSWHCARMAMGAHDCIVTDYVLSPFNTESWAAYLVLPSIVNRLLRKSSCNPESLIKGRPTFIQCEVICAQIVP